MASSDLATKLALIDHTGAALSENKAFFFGADAKGLGEVLATTATAAVAAGNQGRGIFG